MWWDSVKQSKSPQSASSGGFLARCGELFCSVKSNLAYSWLQSHFCNVRSSLNLFIDDLLSYICRNISIPLFLIMQVYPFICGLSTEPEGVWNEKILLLYCMMSKWYNNTYLYCWKIARFVVVLVCLALTVTKYKRL